MMPSRSAHGKEQSEPSAAAQRYSLIDTSRREALESPTMKNVFRTSILALLLGTTGLTAAGPPTAQQLLDRAKAQAAARHKDIFLLFGASW